MKLKSELAPKGISFKSNEFIISDRYATILTVIGYPRTVYHGFLSGIANISGVKLAIKHIPIPFSSLQKMLNKEIADLKDRYQKKKIKQKKKALVKTMSHWNNLFKC